MKLFIACVAALSLFGCADEVATSGDSDINVLGTKASENPREKTVKQSVDDQSLRQHVDVAEVHFSSVQGSFAESFTPRYEDDQCMNCEIMVMHNNQDGRVDQADIMTLNGAFVCRVTQTRTRVIEDTCSSRN